MVHNFLIHFSLFFIMPIHNKLMVLHKNIRKNYKMLIFHKTPLQKDQNFPLNRLSSSLLPPEHEAFCFKSRVAFHVGRVKFLLGLSNMFSILSVSARNQLCELALQKTWQQVCSFLQTSVCAEPAHYFMTTHFALLLRVLKMVPYCPVHAEWMNTCTVEVAAWHRMTLCCKFKQPKPLPPADISGCRETRPA